MQDKIMNRILFFLLCCTITLNHSVFAQSEYTFFTIRGGANHNLFSPQPTDFTPYVFMDTPSGHMAMYPSNSDALASKEKYVDYSISQYAEMLYHYDLKNDKYGIVFGIQYSSTSFSNKYLARPGNFLLQDVQATSIYPQLADYWMIERFTVTSIGLPVFMKIGSQKDFYLEQKYMYFGFQYNLNMKMFQVQEVGWNSKKNIKAADDLMKGGNVLLMLGYNYKIFSLEFDYMIGSLVKNNYVVNDIESGTIIQPYQNVPKRILGIKTSIHIPLSEWLLLKSYSAEKFRRKFKFD